MILTTGLNGFRTVELFQHHDPCQMVGEGHGTHGKLEIRLLLDPGRQSERRTDQKTDTGFAGILYGGQLFREAFTAQFFPFRRKDAEPGTLWDFGENQLRFFFQSC